MHGTTIHNPTRTDKKDDVAHASALYDAAYFRGVGANYRQYELRRRAFVWWWPYLWMFRRIAVRRGNTPLAHLDVGCAYGFFLSHAHWQGDRSMGVDVSAHAIEQAQKRFPHITFAHASAISLPLPDASFDLVTSFHTLEHLHEVPRALAEFRRVLRPWGTLFVVMPYKGLWRRLLGWRDHDATHVSVLPFRQWQSLLRDAQFQVEHAWRYPTAWGGNVLFVMRKNNTRQ